MSDLERRVRKLPKELGGLNGFYRSIAESLIRRQESDGSQDKEEREEELRYSWWILS
jgi:hypothetical protein